MSKELKNKCLYCGEDSHVDENVVCDRVSPSYIIPEELVNPYSNKVSDSSDEILALKKDLIHYENEILKLRLELKEKNDEITLLQARLGTMSRKYYGASPLIRKNSEYKQELNDYQEALVKIMKVTPKISIIHKTARKVINKYKRERDTD